MFTLDLSDERREHAISWIRGEGLLTSPISHDAKILACIALLVCNDLGFAKQEELEAAAADPSAVQAASKLLTDAREGA
jgi:hypothetical protein